MKSHIMKLVGTGSLILITAAMSGPLTKSPEKPEPAESKARLAIQRQVLDHVIPMRVRFSRSRPSQEFRYRTEFEPRTLVKDEVRIPFRVFGWSKKSEIPSLSGYFNASDELVYLLDEKAGVSVVAANHPTFRAKARLTLIPAKPVPVIPKTPKTEPPL